MTENALEPVLAVNGLSVRIQTEQGMLQVLQDISFHIAAGKVLGIVGESGSGKSMLCLAVLGLLQPSARITEGHIRLKGQELVGLPESRMRRIRGQELSLVMQNPMTAFNPVMTVGKQFMETIRAHQNLSRKQAKEKAVACLKQMSLPEPERILDQYPFELSGGMLQRVMIALAISMEPSLLIADEPTTALDSMNRRNVMEAFRAIKAEGRTAILLVSHDLSVIGELADDVIVMKEGQMLEAAPADRLLAAPEHAYTKMLWNARLTAESRNE